jgi:hypothetical protein
MAQTLDRFPSAGGQPRYPWEHWLDGQVWQLAKGDDYTSKAATVIANARTQAKRRGGAVRTRLLNEGGRQTVVLQFRKG